MELVHHYQDLADQLAIGQDKLQKINTIFKQINPVLILKVNSIGKLLADLTAQEKSPTCK